MRLASTHHYPSPNADRTRAQPSATLSSNLSLHRLPEPARPQGSTPSSTAPTHTTKSPATDYFHSPLAPPLAPLAPALRPPSARRAGYPDDEYFDLLHVVTPAFNRAVIYSAQQLHNAYIDDRAVGQLSCSPKQGRLTANVFLK